MLWRKLPGGRFERENALLNELRNQDFFFNEFEGDEGGCGCGGEVADEGKLEFVISDALLHTESLDNWRARDGRLS